MWIQVVSIFFGCIIKLILNIILIRNEQIGIYGAVISNVISYVFILILLIAYLIRKEKINIDIDNFFIKPVILSFLLYIILKNAYKICGTDNNILKLFFSIIIGGIIYIIMMLLFKIITKEDLEIATNGKHKT